MLTELYWRRKLKVPRLTAKANSRIDQVLATLPDREKAAGVRPAAPAVEAERHTPAHYAQKKKRRYKPPEEKPGKTILPEERPARRWPDVLGGLAMALAALALVSLPVMNWLFPSLTETMPGLGVVFQALNHPRQPDIEMPVFPELPEASDLSPSPEPAYDLTLADSKVLGQLLLLDLRLDPVNGALPDAAQLTTGWNGKENLSVTVNGGPTELYSAVTFRQKEGRFQGRALLRLPSGFRPTVRTMVTVEIDGLYAADETVSPLSAAPVEKTFEIPGGSTLAMDDLTAAVVDNGVGLGEIHYQPGEGTLSLTLSTPVLTEAMNLYVWTMTDDGTIRGGVVEDRGEEDGRQRFYYRWENLSEGAERMTLLVFADNWDRDPPFAYGALTNKLLAEFTVELAEETAYVTESYPDLGYEKTEIAVVLAQLEAGLCFGEDHLALLEQRNGLVERDDPHRMIESMEFIFASDLDASLPLEAVAFLDGSERLSMPLETDYAGKTDQGWSRSMDGASLDIFRWEVLETPNAYWLGSFTSRMYLLTVWFDSAATPEDNFWKEHEIALRFRDPATGREFELEPQSAGLFFQRRESGDAAEAQGSVSAPPAPTPDPADPAEDSVRSEEPMELALPPEREYPDGQD